MRRKPGDVQEPEGCLRRCGGLRPAQGTNIAVDRHHAALLRVEG